MRSTTNTLAYDSDGSSPHSSVYLCNDDSAIEELDYRDIPSEKVAQIRLFHRLDTGHNWRIAFFFGLWIVSGIAVLYIDSILVSILATCLIGSCIAALPIFTHEASHQLLSKNKSINRLLGFVCGLPGLISTTSYLSMHLLHHAHTHTEKDPDNIENSVRWYMPITFIYYLVLVVGVPAYIPLVAIEGYKNAHAGRRRSILVEYVVIATVLVCLFALLPFSFMLKLWLLPLIVTTVLSNVRGLAEHGLTRGGNVFTQTRTVLSIPLVRFLMCNLNYHLEHHLFPGVPWYNLPKVHLLLQDEFRRSGASMYPSYSSFLIDFVRVSMRGVQPNMRMVHQKVRSQFCA